MSKNSIQHWQLPYTTEDNATDADDYLLALSQAKDGFYPLGENRLWHGGIHLHDKVIDALGGDTLGCIADGDVIAYQIDKQYPSVDYGEFKATFSSGFTLVRHILEIPQPPAPASTETATSAETANAAENTQAESQESNVGAETVSESDSENTPDTESAANTEGADVAQKNTGNAETGGVVNNAAAQDSVTSATEPKETSQTSDSDSGATTAEMKNTMVTAETSADSDEATKADSTETSPDLSPSSSANPVSSAADLTFYSLYMHLSDWKSYENNPELARPGYWQSNEYVVGEKADDGVRGCRVRVNGGGTKVLAVLIRGTQVRVGAAISKASPNWRKLEAIVSGTALPALSDEPLPGYVYIKDMRPTPGDNTLFTVDEGGNDISETEKGINIRKGTSAADDKKSWLSWLPAKAKISVSEVVGSGDNRWGKIDAILEGTAYPALPKDENGSLQGWVHLKNLNEQPAKPKNTGEIVESDVPYPIKAGELIGHPGVNQDASDAQSQIPPYLLTHIELFTCADLPTIISQSRSQWKNVGETHKTQTVIHKGAMLYRPTEPDRTINAQTELSRFSGSKTSGPWTEVEMQEGSRPHSLIIARNQVGGRIKPGATNTYGGYRLNQTQKKAIADMLNARGETLTASDIPDSVDFGGTFYHDKDDGKTELYKPGNETPPKGYGRRDILFSTIPKVRFWVDNNAIVPTTGKRSDLALTLKGWNSYPLQKGKNALDNKIGFNYLVAEPSKEKPDAAEETQEAENSSVKLAVDSDGKRWHSIECVDEGGQPVKGWVKEEAPDATRYAPWEWPLFETVRETATPKQQLDRMNRGITLDEVDRTPLMQALHDLIDVNNDKSLSSSELQEALQIPWLATQLSRLAVNYESEWFADQGLSKWNALDDWLEEVLWSHALDELKQKALSCWQADIKKLLWWNKLAGKHGTVRRGIFIRRAWWGILEGLKKTITIMLMMMGLYKKLGLLKIKLINWKEGI